MERRDKIDEAAKLLSKLNIADEGKAAMNELEWTGKYTEDSKMDEEKIVELDSDDEEDALKILSQVCMHYIKDICKIQLTRFFVIPIAYRNWCS